MIRRLYKKCIVEFIILCLLLDIAYNYFSLKQMPYILEMKLQDSGITKEEASDCISRVADKMDVVIWEEVEAELSGEMGKSVSGAVILKAGNNRLLYPDSILLSDEDSDGCIVSGKTARSLFGSDQVIGLEVHYNDREYIIRDVIDATSEILIMNAPDSVPDSEKLRLPYLTSGIRGGKIQEKKQYLFAYAGLDGKEWGYHLIHRVLLSFMLLNLALFTAIFRKETEKVEGESWKKKVLDKFFLFLMTAFISCIVIILVTVAGWPARWSDFGQWRERFETIRETAEFLLRSKKPLVIGERLKQYGWAFAANIGINIIFFIKMRK